MQTIFYAYARCSTVEQNLEHQIAQARATGFDFDEVVSDHGVSGVSTKLYDRPEGKRLKDRLRRGDSLVCRWIDRLGRDYTDTFDVLTDLMRKGVIVKTVVNRMTFDGAATDPIHCAIRDAQLAMMSGMAAAQAEAMKEAQKAGIAHAKTQGRYRGRKPSFTADQLAVANSMLRRGDGVGVVAKETGLSRQTVYRIRDDYPAAAKSLRNWVG